MSTFEVQIPIHMPGTRTTDHEMAAELNRGNPKAFRTAQDLLVAAEKLMFKKGGIFSSEKKRQKKFLTLLNQLYSDLMMDPDYIKHREKGEAWVLIIYLANLSMAFPNWQDVYTFLNEAIPTLYNR
ncbi:hypothetical protein [Gracilimonas mengyeensis]|uniref:Uncharacterized protein n=1 Tax=Gracilimonas mengyeensis TaxID=1302730 RepID=A0A521FES6_9BACT|nr:hypothetical protein [Gracilimonas mengyeensis]SMO94619.1 hypothetical protein SAMN06265219_1182 [Gracilimonas mengyeensis]